VSALILHHPRWWHWLRSQVRGYFWLPCPLCGRMFGGHEWHHRGQDVPTGEHGVGAAICPWCADEGRGWSPWHAER